MKSWIWWYLHVYVFMPLMKTHFVLWTYSTVIWKVYVIIYNKNYMWYFHSLRLWNIKISSSSFFFILLRFIFLRTILMMICCKFLDLVRVLNKKLKQLFCIVENNKISITENLKSRKNKMHTFRLNQGVYLYCNMEEQKFGLHN